MIEKLLYPGRSSRLPINTTATPQNGMVSDGDKRIELEDLVGPYLVPGAPYYWWKDPEAGTRTLQESEAQGGFDTEPLHATIDDQLCDLRFEEVEPGNEKPCD